MTLVCPGRTADCAGVSRRKGENKSCVYIVQVWISHSSGLRHAFAGQDLNGEGGERTQRAFTQGGFASQLPCPSPCRGSFFVLDCFCFILYLIFCAVCLLVVFDYLSITALIHN